MIGPVPATAESVLARLSRRRWMIVATVSWSSSPCSRPVCSATMCRHRRYSSGRSLRIDGPSTIGAGDPWRLDVGGLDLASGTVTIHVWGPWGGSGVRRGGLGRLGRDRDPGRFDQGRRPSLCVAEVRIGDRSSRRRRHSWPCSRWHRSAGGSSVDDRRWCSLVDGDGDPSGSVWQRRRRRHRRRAVRSPTRRGDRRREHRRLPSAGRSPRSRYDGRPIDHSSRCRRCNRRTTRSTSSRYPGHRSPSSCSNRRRRFEPMGETPVSLVTAGLADRFGNPLLDGHCCVAHDLRAGRAWKGDRSHHRRSSRVRDRGACRGRCADAPSRRRRCRISIPRILTSRRQSVSFR